MTIPGSGPVLRRPGPFQEHAVGADASLLPSFLADQRAVGRLRLLAWHSPSGEGDYIAGFDKLFLMGIDASTVTARYSKGGLPTIPEFVLRCLPGHVRCHHHCPDRRLICRAHQVLGRAVVLDDPVVHLQLPADGTHGLVLGGSGCLHHRRSRRKGHRYCRLAVADGRAGLSPAGTVVHINAAVSPVWWVPMLLGKRTRLRQGSFRWLRIR